MCADDYWKRLPEVTGVSGAHNSYLHFITSWRLHKRPKLGDLQISK